MRMFTSSQQWQDSPSLKTIGGFTVHVCRLISLTDLSKQKRSVFHFFVSVSSPLTKCPLPFQLVVSSHSSSLSMFSLPSTSSSFSFRSRLLVFCLFFGLFSYMSARSQQGFRPESSGYHRQGVSPGCVCQGLFDSMCCHLVGTHTESRQALWGHSICIRCNSPLFPWAWCV